MEMKSIYLLLSVLIPSAMSQSLPDLGPCINTCINGVESNLQSAPYNCDGMMDYACFCSTKDFSNGIRDCTNEACGGNGNAAAQKVTAALDKLCKAVGTNKPKPATTGTSVKTITTTGPVGNIRTVVVSGASRSTLTLKAQHTLSTYTTTGPVGNIRTVVVSDTARSTLPLKSMHTVSTYTTTGPAGNIRTVVVSDTARNTLTLKAQQSLSTYTTTGPVGNIRTVVVSDTVRSTLPLRSSNSISTYTTTGGKGNSRLVVVSGTSRSTLRGGIYAKYITTTQNGMAETLAVLGGMTSTLAKGATQTIATSKGGKAQTLAVVNGKTSTITGGGVPKVTGTSGSGGSGSGGSGSGGSGSGGSGSGGDGGGNNGFTVSVGPLLGLTVGIVTAALLL